VVVDLGASLGLKWNQRDLVVSVAWFEVEAARSWCKRRLV